MGSFISTPTTASASTTPGKKKYSVLRNAIIEKNSKNGLDTPKLLFDTWDKFVFIKDTREFTYDPTTFSRIGVWLIERCSTEISVFSLESFAPRKFKLVPLGGTILRIHVTVIASTWDSDGEFHVTIEKIVKSRGGNRASVVCTDFYKIAYNNTAKEIRSKSSRPVCVKDSELLKTVSKYHADLFTKSFF